jgi:hypothetical protein
MLYFCRYYSFRSEDAWRQQVGPGRRLSTQPLRLGVYLADPPVFAVGMIASAADPSLRLLRRPGHFEAVASMVPSVAAAIRPDTATPISDVFSMGCLPSYLRRYPPGEPAEGFFLAGDALMAVNPAYGRGITLATMHSLVLADALAEARGDLRTAAHVAAEGFAGQVEPWFWDSTVREVQEGLPPFGEVEAIQPAGRYLAALRILHMLDLPAGPIDSSAVADHIVSSHELPANGDGPAHPGPASTGTEEQAMAEVRRALASAGAHHDG